ncbi:alpha/beta hydrolase [Ensifer aridi]|uniref:alpha/beta hydrolase n=1 Tax=Ensifer aridi TaxID=1708715 RepID=UPI00111BE493|nr:alpha/beta hydrolase [Ensifer aridi]
MLKRNFRLDRSVEWNPLEHSCTLEDLQILEGQQVVYSISHRGFDIRVFAFLRPASRRLTVFGQDAIRPGNTVLPLFHRWSWYTRLEGSMLVFNDPTLLIHPRIGCGWSQGRSDAFAVDATADVVRRFGELLGIAAGDALLFGTSAGGFWALMAGAALASRQVVVDIPQVDLFSYPDRSAREAMFNACYPGLDETQLRRSFPDRLRVVDRFRALGRAPRNVLYCQNLRDVKHVRTQMKPFRSEIELLQPLCNGKAPDVRFRFYDREGEGGRGHIQMEAEPTIEILNECLELAA